MGIRTERRPGCLVQQQSVEVNIVDAEVSLPAVIVIILVSQGAAKKQSFCLSFFKGFKKDFLKKILFIYF